MLYILPKTQQGKADNLTENRVFFCGNNTRICLPWIHKRYLRPTPVRNNHCYNFVEVFFISINNSMYDSYLYCAYLCNWTVQLTIASYLLNYRWSYLNKWCTVCAILCKRKSTLFNPCSWNNTSNLYILCICTIELQKIDLSWKLYESYPAKWGTLYATICLEIT